MMGRSKETVRLAREKLYVESTLCPSLLPQVAPSEEDEDPDPGKPNADAARADVDRDAFAFVLMTRVLVKWARS